MPDPFVDQVSRGSVNGGPICGRAMERCQDPLQGPFFICPVHGVILPGRSDELKRTTE